MPDPFHRLIPEARAFLTELRDNNSREWFQGEKQRYEQQLKGPALLLLDHLAAEFGTVEGAPTTPKLFRPHRDVRFSKDKTPYHTHLHMLWSLGAPPGQRPCLFFGISPDYVRLGGGVMDFDKQGLTNWRQAVDSPLGAELAQMLERLAQQGARPEEPDLKRVPAPYPKDHPQADLLRRKGLTLWRDLPGDEWADPLAALRVMQNTLQPLLTRLQGIA